MPTILVQPIASSTVEVDLSEDATVADLKSALAQKTGIDIEEQRLVTRGKLLEDSTLIHLVDGRIFLARGSLSKKGDGDEIELTVKMVGATGTWQLRLQADSSTTDFKNQVLLQLNLPTAELGRYHFVTNGQLMGDVGKLSGLLKDGDNVVVVPPRVPAHLRRIKAIYHWMAWLLRRLGAVLFMFCRFAWILPGTVLRYTLDAWYDPWSLVRPRGEEVRGRHLRGLGVTPQMLRYAPGQNPHGEDLTALLSQGLLGM
ncbi:Uncharacterized protein SCF082_LOCUS32124 [Durusdinium trenchii]|uniref:Ubiquitin-like domain-containing protein n=1 Tax=Durusdinium trenchii TaxID=1381693 RepID=A0ABP0NBW4_9DINO